MKGKLEVIAGISATIGFLLLFTDNIFITILGIIFLACAAYTGNKADSLSKTLDDKRTKNNYNKLKH